MNLLLFLFILHGACGITTIINTWGNQGFVDAHKKAKENLHVSSMYALVEGLSTCEVEQCDGTVGFGGSPDETGETTLEAMVMDGRGLKIGAVSDLREISDPARVAWAVLNYTKHTILAGEGARDFAKAMGFKATNLSTLASLKMHDDWIKGNCQPNFWKNVSPDPSSKCGPYLPGKIKEDDHTTRIIDSFNHDTIGMVIIQNDDVVAGTSTNGAKFKIPGRVGDSPIPGAGAYAMEGVGGAAATGDGDTMMRMLPSLLTVQFMELGAHPMRAARKTVEKMLKFFPNFQGAVVAANIKGKVGAACANLATPFKYVVTLETNTTVQQVPCLKPGDLKKKMKSHKKNDNSM